ELPILDSPAAILLSIMEIQHALLDARVDHKSASTLLYSIQLAIQVQPNESSLGSHTRGILECPELEHDLEMERARGLRPAAETCNRCPKQDDCTSPSTCRKLPKPAHSPTSPSSRPERAAVARVVEGPAVPSIATDLNSIASNSNLPSSRLERAAVARVVEGPASTGAPAARRLSPENATTLSAPSFCHAEERSDEASLSPARTNINSSIAVHVDPADPDRSVSRIESPAFCHAEAPRDEASLSTAPAQCHPERSAKRGAEGSFV